MFKNETGFGKYLRSKGWDMHNSGDTDYYTSYGTTCLVYTKDGKRITLGLMSIPELNTGTFIGIQSSMVYARKETPRPYKYFFCPSENEYEHYEGVLNGQLEPIWD